LLRGNDAVTNRDAVKKVITTFQRMQFMQLTHISNRCYAVFPIAVVWLASIQIPIYFQLVIHARARSLPSKRISSTRTRQEERREDGQVTRKVTREYLLTAVNKSWAMSKFFGGYKSEPFGATMKDR
jgi:hypothetical protein